MITALVTVTLLAAWVGLTSLAARVWNAAHLDPDSTPDV